MAALSDYYAQQIMNRIFHAVAGTTPVATYVALTTAPVGHTDTGSTITEPVGGSYARVLVNQTGAVAPRWTVIGSPTTYEIDNLDAIVFPTATGSWGTVTGVVLVDAVTAGNIIFFGTLSSSQLIGNGNTAQFDASALQFIIDQ